MCIRDRRKTVVDEVEDPDEQMLPEEAARYVKNPKVGDVVEMCIRDRGIALHRRRLGHPVGIFRMPLHPGSGIGTAGQGLEPALAENAHNRLHLSLIHI